MLLCSFLYFLLDHSIDTTACLCIWCKLALFHALLTARWITIHQSITHLTKNMRLLIHHVNYSGCIFLKAQISIHDTEHDFNPLTSKHTVKQGGIQRGSGWFIPQNAYKSPLIVTKEPQEKLREFDITWYSKHVSVQRELNK